MRILMILMMILMFGAFFIISENNLALNQHRNIEKFYSMYSNWLSNLFDNSKNLTVYAIKLKWIP